MKKLSYLLVLSIFLLTGCSKNDASITGDRAVELRNGNGNSVTKPFKATATVSPEALANGVFVGFCDGQFGNFDIVNSGSDVSDINATHMGKISFVTAEACVRPFLLDDPEVFPPETYGPFLQVIELFPIPGEITQDDVWTAANGTDQLYISMTFNSFPNPDNKFAGFIVGTFEITGGAGKFEGATGGGTLVGSASADFINPAYPYVREFDGEITY